MKILARIGLVLGICVTLSLIAGSGAASVLQLLSRAGWWLPWLVPLHVLPLLLDVTAWRVLIPAPCRPQALFFIAIVREGINRLLPVANIGGEVIGVHLLIRRGIAAPVAAASIVVETLLTMLSQYIFASLGLMCMVALAGHVQIFSRILLSLALSLPVILAFGLLLMHGSTFRRLEHAASGLFARFSSGVLAVRHWGLLDAAIRSLMTDPRRLITATVWQLLGLLAGCAETWLVLRWLGHPVSTPAAIALESLTQAARSIFFLVPAGLGVQEAGLIGLGNLLGIDADVAISLSLAKRLREILFGLPALGLWQWLEGGSGSRLHDRVEP
jgi:putative membrane protein